MWVRGNLFRPDPRCLWISPSVKFLKKYLEEHNVGKYMALAGDLPEYLHGIDGQADEMYKVMYEKLSKSEQFKKTGDFMHDLHVESEIKRRIEEEILNELVYVS